MKTKTKVLTVLIVATFLLTLSATKVFSDQTYSFHVTDLSGNPISNASVYLIVYEGSMNIPLNSVQTDSNGNAVLTVLSGESVSSWTVEANGYVTQTGNGPSASMNIQLSPVGSSSPSQNPPSNAPGLNDHGIQQWNFSLNGGEIFVFLLILAVLVILLIKRGNKKEK